MFRASPSSDLSTQLPHRLPFWDSRPDGRWWELNFGSQEHLALLSLRAQEDFRHYRSMPCPDTWLTKWPWCWLTSRPQIATVSSEVKMNERGTEATPGLLLGKQRLRLLRSPCSSDSLTIEVSSTETPGGWVHTCFFSSLSVSVATARNSWILHKNWQIS